MHQKLSENKIAHENNYCQHVFDIIFVHRMSLRFTIQMTWRRFVVKVASRAEIKAAHLCILTAYAEICLNLNFGNFSEVACVGEFSHFRCEILATCPRKINVQIHFQAIHLFKTWSSAKVFRTFNVYTFTHKQSTRIVTTGREFFLLSTPNLECWLVGP